LDELIRVSETARNKLLTVEDLTEIELAEMKESMPRLPTEGGIGERSCKAAADTRAAALLKGKISSGKEPLFDALVSR
jgi:low affinity Fe/Cu permease